MKSIFAIIMLLAIALGLYYWSTASTTTAVFRDKSIPLSFSYPSGEDGYVLLEQELGLANQDLLKTLVLMDPDDYQSVLGGERAGGEGPPTMTIQIYRNPLNHSPQVWAESNANLSNWPLITGSAASTTVANQSAITFDADGLYPNRNIIFTFGDKVYYINGSYLERESALYYDFDPLIKSIKLED